MRVILGGFWKGALSLRQPWEAELLLCSAVRAARVSRNCLLRTRPRDHPRRRAGRGAPYRCFPLTSEAGFRRVQVASLAVFLGCPRTCACSNAQLCAFVRKAGFPWQRGCSSQPAGLPWRRAKLCSSRSYLASLQAAQLSVFVFKVIAFQIIFRNVKD